MKHSNKSWMQRYVDWAQGEHSEDGGLMAVLFLFGFAIAFIGGALIGNYADWGKNAGGIFVVITFVFFVPVNIFIILDVLPAIFKFILKHNNTFIIDFDTVKWTTKPLRLKL